MAQQESRRLVISSMVLENFKSYAGAQRVGPFHKSFSSVVGPNGSGKSNVIDAMLFVFGRRAKQLRFNKVSELIHNSTNFRNLDSAKVTVHFEDIIDKEGEDFEVVPNSQFTVARTANRNNTSDYYINDRRVPAKDVTDKLKGLGIDLDNNRFLILQGEVEQISMMRPKGEDKNETGLLEYLEDIIGTDKYVQPIEAAAKSLEEINDTRQGMIQRLKISEKEKDALESKKTEAEMFLSKQADMFKDRICAHTININSTQENLNKLEQQAKELESKLVYEREKFKAHDKEAKAAEKKFAGVEKEFKAIQKALSSAQEDFKNFERKDTKCQIELKNARSKVKKLAGKLESDAAEAAKLEAEVAAIQANAPLAQERLEQLQQQLGKAEAALEAVLEGIKWEVEGYHQQLSQVRVELAPWEKRIGEVDGRISVIASERDVLSKKADDAKRRLDAALKAMSGAQQGAAHKQKQMAEIRAATERCRQQIATHKAELAAGHADEAKLEAAMRETRERAGTLRADVNGSAQKSGLVLALMTAKARNEVSGVYGRLGDLGAIDAKYDVAVSTAVGALDYIVVETTSDAQRCVEYLRKNNLGVATFLILEKQKHLAAAASQKVQTPEGVPRLYDLVKIKDDKLRPAFMYAMQNTLVADTLDQAARISYNSERKFKRVVTLQGQLIAETGTMSGGGNRQSRGRMTLGSAAPRASAAADAKAAAAELKKEEAKLEELNVKLRSARDQIAACTKALKAAERQLSELELAAPKAEMEAKAEQDKAADIQQRLEELERATKVDVEDARRIRELSLEIAREEQALVELRSQTQGLEAKAGALQVKIDSAGGEKLKKAKAAVVKLEKEIADAETDAAKKAVQVSSHTKHCEKLKKERAKDEKERERMEGEVKCMEQELHEMEDQAAKVLALVQATQEQLVAKQQEVDAAQAELAGISARHGIIRKTEYEIETALEQMSKLHKEESGKVKAWEADTESLQQKYTEATGGEAVMVDAADLQKSAEDYFFHASVLEAELVKMAPDLSAIQEFQAKAADYNQRAQELDAVTTQRDEVRRQHDTLRKARLDEFMAGFNIISLKLKEMYQMITLGGDAELELVDSLDPFTEGIVFSVRPPKKSWKNISNLSGGEKTLSSLSLVFALHHYKPTPLYVMDEIDAALDFKNVSIVGHYIKDRTKNAQFIIISLRNNMFELADRLVGIYKTDNTTKTVAINPGRFVMPSISTPAPATAGKENNGAGPQPMAVA